MRLHDFYDAIIRSTETAIKEKIDPYIIVEDQKGNKYKLTTLTTDIGYTEDNKKIGILTIGIKKE